MRGKASETMSRECRTGKVEAGTTGKSRRSVRSYGQIGMEWEHPQGMVGKVSASGSGSSPTTEGSRWRYLPIRACRWVSCQPSEYKLTLRNVPSSSNLAAAATWHDASLCTEWCSSNR